MEHDKTLSGGRGNVQQATPNPGDEAPAGSPGTGEDICGQCAGSGKLADGRACPNCGGTGKVTEGIGGG